MSVVYHINKGVDRAIEFKGLKAKYIWWLGAGIVVLMFLFAILYLMGVDMVICVMIILISGGFLFWFVYRLSKRYGEHGMMKKIAANHIPKRIKRK